MVKNLELLQARPAFQQNWFNAGAMWAAAPASAMEHLDARFDAILEVIQDIRVVIQDIRVVTQDIRVAIRAEVQGVQRKLCVNQDRDFARTLNLNMPRVSTVLMALPREDGELPPGFPETHDAFKNLNGDR
ncbi:hypothetical protein FS749_005833 [Ceratobasidium sp. UAMH 11750]|nr:hypothetical protein FS749_005833 [Ceratobasidium sp. UAMH 11750]